MGYSVFYTLYERGQSVASDNPVMMEPAEIGETILAAMDGDGDFLGLMDQHGTTLQFIYHQDTDRFRVEIPLLDERASHGCWLTYSGCEALLKALPETLHVKAFPAFSYTSWNAP